MGAKMNAIVMNAADSISLEKVEIPTPNDDEVLCLVESVAICGSDIKFIKGDTIGSWPPYVPFILNRPQCKKLKDWGSGCRRST
jgi:L-iditol 2-dehydrogenase